MAIVEVVHRWDDRFGECYDCGAPAAYEAPDIYGAQGRSTQNNRFCSTCAAMHAANGEKIVWLFREIYEEQDGPNP